MESSMSWFVLSSESAIDSTGGRPRTLAWIRINRRCLSRCNLDQASLEVHRQRLTRPRHPSTLRGCSVDPGATARSLPRAL